MKQFRLLKRTRQITEYSCGASALQSVLSYWGRDVDETELMKLMGTSDEVGTYPEDMVRGARTLGFEAESKENLTLRDLEEFTADGKPVIVVGQFWRSASGPARSVAEDWSSGHYVVVLGVDKDYVYIQDPYMRMSKAFVPRKSFEDHWHQVMGGDLENKPKLIHLGIFVRGDKPAESAAVEEADIASLKLAEMGSFNLMVTEFRGFLLPFDFLDELRDVWKQQGVRPSAFIFLRKDKDGNVMGMQGSGIEDDDEAVVAMNAVLSALASRALGRPEARKSKIESAMKAAAAGDFGLSAADFREIADKLPPDHSAIIALFENVWEKRFKQAVKKHGGAVTSQQLISPEAAAKAASEIAATDRPAAG